MSRGPFYPILGVGPYTISEWKVVFKDLSELFQCCVLGPDDSSIPGKPIIADYTLRLIPARTDDEAHYIAALLNSSPSAAALYFSSTGVQTQRYHAADAEKIAIAPWSGAIKQASLARLSKTCHELAKAGDMTGLKAAARELDQTACDYWGIPARELNAVREVLSPLERSFRLYEGIGSVAEKQLDQDGG